MNIITDLLWTYLMRRKKDMFLSPFLILCNHQDLQFYCLLGISWDKVKANKYEFIIELESFHSLKYFSSIVLNWSYPTKSRKQKRRNQKYGWNFVIGQYWEIVFFRKKKPRAIENYLLLTQYSRWGFFFDSRKWCWAIFPIFLSVRKKVSWSPEYQIRAYFKHCFN